MLYNNNQLEKEDGSFEQVLSFFWFNADLDYLGSLTSLPGTKCLNTGKRVCWAEVVRFAAVLQWAGGKHRDLAPSAGHLSGTRLRGAVGTVTPTPG